MIQTNFEEGPDYWPEFVAKRMDDCEVVISLLDEATDTAVLSDFSDRQILRHLLRNTKVIQRKFAGQLEVLKSTISSADEKREALQEFTVATDSLWKACGSTLYALGAPGGPPDGDLPAWRQQLLRRPG